MRMQNEQTLRAERLWFVDVRNGDVSHGTGWRLPVEAPGQTCWLVERGPGNYGIVKAESGVFASAQEASVFLARWCSGTTDRLGEAYRAMAMLAVEMKPTK